MAMEFPLLPIALFTSRLPKTAYEIATYQRRGERFHGNTKIADLKRRLKAVPLRRLHRYAPKGAER